MQIVTEIKLSKCCYDSSYIIKPKAIVFHHTATNSLQTTIDVLEQRKLSAHYIIGKDGAIYNVVDEQFKAWHAGESFWNGMNGMNLHSIGVEIVNLGDEQFTCQQMDSALYLAEYLCEKYEIRHENIIGHADIAPLRKVDPNVNFDWEYLYCNGIGRYSLEQGDTNVLFKLNDACDEVFELRSNLREFGYNVSLTNVYDSELCAVVRAFNMHYSKESYALHPQCWDVQANLRLQDMLGC